MDAEQKELNVFLIKLNTYEFTMVKKISVKVSISVEEVITALMIKGLNALVKEYL